MTICTVPACPLADKPICKELSGYLFIIVNKHESSGPSIYASLHVVFCFSRVIPSNHAICPPGCRAPQTKGLVASPVKEHSEQSGIQYKGILQVLFYPGLASGPL